MSRFRAERTTAHSDIATARAALAKVRVRLVLIGIAGVSAGALGWEWTGQIRWWGLAVIGLGALLTLIPIRAVIRGIDRNHDSREA
jgi:hypothetical protein